MRAFELYDYVFLTSNPGLSGTVERTNTESYEPLEDELIIGHTEVPVDIINEFVLNGAPPAGYVYVAFEDESAGNSLVCEDDLTLLSRTFHIGDTVRKDDSPLTGAVINLSESYVLAPILSCPNLFLSKLPNSPHFQKCGPTCPSSLPAQIHHPNPHVLISNVPAQEVKHAQDLVEDDLIITGDWVGQVEDVQYDVVICLENLSIVVVRGSECLYLPVRDNGKPLIALPEEEGWRPDVVVSLQGWSHTIPLLFPRVGQFVVAKRRALYMGRWVRGSYDPKCPAQGTILDVRAGEAAVTWSQHDSPFDPSSRHLHSNPPPYDMEIYTHGQDFKDSASLRPRTDLTIYDHGILPTKSQGLSQSESDLISKAQNAQHGKAIGSQEICTGHDVKIGNQVRFRDITAAAVKYQGTGDNAHGSVTRFDPDLFYGWDLNEFKILHIRQETTVLWQDGTVSTVDSLSLKAYTLFEPELAPTDVVLKRDGMRQKAVGPQTRGSPTIKGFDEMTFFEKPHDLLPKSVGIIQTVNPVERVARVRWFKAPKIELRANGQAMSPLSRYGPIGDKIEDVSLYEIMSFPSLQRKRRDMCIIVPPASDVAQSKDASSNPSSDTPAEPQTTASSTASPKIIHSHKALLRRERESSSAWKPQTQSPIDWFGEIVALGLDGSSTIRLGGLKPCRDIQISSDSILALIEDANFLGNISDDDAMDVDSWGESEWSDEVDNDGDISETVEYEGGHRLDDDSGDENWVSEDDGQASLADGNEKANLDSDVEMEQASHNSDEAMREPIQRSIVQLKNLIASEAPPQFAVLECDPPSDQFGLHSTSTASTVLKRISKEHQILATSLPEGEIYVRTYESRLDLLRCLIIGPRDTPYEGAPFLIDFHLPEKFPVEPPTAHFHSWTSGLGRINPNLYEEGKICLSLLGTWSGKHESEKWSDKATILQLLVSLQGLVFVKRPFYNEAGFEGYENDSAYTREAELYSEKAYLMARGFVKHALTQPPGGLEDVLAWIYLSEKNSSSASLLKSVIQRGRRVIQRSDEASFAKDGRLMDAGGEKEDLTKVFLRPLSRGAIVMLNRIINELEEKCEQLNQSTDEQGIEPTA